jgi:hypothetical protein
MISVPRYFPAAVAARTLTSLGGAGDPTKVGINSDRAAEKNGPAALGLTDSHRNSLQHVTTSSSSGRFP